MLADNFPVLSRPFADSGAKNSIPDASQISITPGAASFETGFPPLTMTPLLAGGIPPMGEDFNGILYFITYIQRFQSAGMVPKYDAAFSTAVNGYPKGAVLQKDNEQGWWVSTVNNNTSDPDGGSPTGWADAFQAIYDTLNLGTISTQDANAVAITGGSVSGITDLAVADGGTGASDAASARSNLGLGSAAVRNTGTSGTVVPLLSEENTWGSDQILNNGTSDSPAMCWQVPGLILRSDLLILGGKTIFRIWWNAGSAGEIAAEYNITDATAKIFGQDVYTKGNVSSFAQTLLDDADAPTARGTLGAISSADVPGIVAGFGYNTLGSHVLARLNTGTGTGSVPFQPGTTVSGANLIPDNCAGDETGLSGGALTGTWMLKGFIYNADAVTDPDSISLFLKVAN